LAEVFVLSSIRVKFIRGEEVKYISHLDLMKAFERALRRSKLPIAYSEGFNPHPKMVFGLPLSVGVTSEAEYADFEFSEDIKVSELIEILNPQLPSGLAITDAGVKADRKNIMAEITRASYCVNVCVNSKVGINQMKRIIDDFMLKGEIRIIKKTKSGMKETDIKPMIHSIGVESMTRASNNEGCTGNVFKISTVLSAGSRGNLKPEQVVEAVSSMAGEPIKLLSIHRTGLFIESGGEIIEPLKYAMMQK
jgi:radical SAM-linked protein